MVAGWLDGLVAVAGGGPWATDGVVLQAGGGVDLTTLFGLASVPRATLVGGSILALGGALLWWNAVFLDRSADAAMERPVTSVAYGIAAHLAIAFAGITLTAKLGRVDAGNIFLGWIGVVTGVGLLLVTAMIGFSVVGTILVGTLGRESRLLGVVLGAIIAASITLVDPLVAVATWLVVVSAGIGGAARRWYTADALPST